MGCQVGAQACVTRLFQKGQQAGVFANVRLMQQANVAISNAYLCAGEPVFANIKVNNPPADHSQLSNNKQID